jgi:hypothetical protein
MSFLSLFQAWFPLISVAVTVAGWIFVSLSNRSSNRNAALLATRNQARTDISAALEQYLGYLHDLIDPAAVAFDMSNANALGIKQNQVLNYAPELMAQLAARFKHDPRLGAGGLQILKGYLPLFPNAEEVIVGIQLGQLDIEDHLADYFARIELPIKEELVWQTAPTSMHPGDLVSRIQRTDAEKNEIWSEISIVNDFIEWLNYTVLKDLTRTRGRWMWTGNPEYCSHLDSVEARLSGDRNGKPHIASWKRESKEK